MFTTRRPPGQSLSFLRQGDRAVVAVELVDGLAPLRSQHAVGLIGPRAHTGGDDQHVVGELASVGERDHLLLGAHHVDLAVLQIHTRVQCGATRLGYLRGLVRAERHEQVAGLVAVIVIGIDDGDLPLALVQFLVELVGRHRSGGSTTQNQ
jgi:hypothetical protein